MFPPSCAGYLRRVTASIAWQLRGRALALDRPIVVGIVNVTPDSFSDGGQFLGADAAVSHAARLLEDGADVLDIGGESTRPQAATPVAADEERRRVLPVVRALRARFPDAVLSVDTVKSEVARDALDAGADVINDVSAFRLDPRVSEITAAAGAGVILMHSRGDVSEMATFAHANYGTDVAAEVFAELRGAAERAIAAGVARESIVLDPGVGFAKRGEHSLAVLAALPRLAEAGFPVMVGVSRKRFIGELTGVTDPLGRVHGTTGANVAALTRGARLFRVHDVQPARQALDVAWAALGLGGAA